MKGRKGGKEREREGKKELGRERKSNPLRGTRVVYEIE